MQRLIAIGFIWLGCAVAWVVLGSSIDQRTGQADSSLNAEVAQLWGPQLDQLPPSATWYDVETYEDTVTSYDKDGRPNTAVVKRQRSVPHAVPLVKTDADASLSLEHRRKGLLWFPTYDVAFRGQYTFHNDAPGARTLQFAVPLNAASIVYDGFEVRSGGNPVTLGASSSTGASWSATVGQGEDYTFEVRYRSRGTSRWTYGAFHSGLGTNGAQVKDFALTLRTDFANVDFPPGSLSPSRHGVEANAWTGEWRFSTLLSGSPISIDLPQRMNPGPLASRITFFAPVGLLFFFFVVAVLAAARGVRIHPLNYFLFGCGFFAFHLLFAYLVDHVAVMPAFLGSAAVSVFLVVSYARLFTGWRFALGQMAFSQLVYLVLFSFTFFWQGFTGLAITVGAVLTLFVIMQLTGRVDWAEATKKPAAQPA